MDFEQMPGAQSKASMAKIVEDLEGVPELRKAIQFLNQGKNRAAVDAIRDALQIMESAHDVTLYVG